MSEKALPSGTKLRYQSNTYTIESVIGSGGFGITYKASVPTKLRNITSHAPIAIKEHFPAADCERSATTSSITYSRTARDRVMTSLKEFIEEAQCLQRIAGLHPNIVNVNEVFEANNTAYYVMEYLEGLTLKQHVLDHRQLSVHETLSIMMPVIEAVATLHKNRFTHLDIKPSNIMLCENDDGTKRPVLIDFGLAKHYNPDGSATATLAVSGFSDGYAPIEQYSGITCFSPAVDVYSLGATILFCLTGKTPPRAVELSQTALNAIIPRDIPDRLRKLLLVTMSFQAADRLPNAQQLYLELKPIAENEGVQVVSSGIPSVKTPDTDITRRNGSSGDKDDATHLAENQSFESDDTQLNDPDIHTPPVNQPRQSRQSETPHAYGPKKEKEGTPVWIWITIALLVVAIAIAGYLIYNNNRQLPPPPPKIEDNETGKQKTTTTTGGSMEKTEKTIRKETVADSYATPDLGFHNLSGPVKSCKNQWGAVLPFNQSGEWTGNYSDELGPRTFTRDSQGRITEESYHNGPYGSGTIYYTWDGNKVVSMTDDNRNQQVYYTYNSDGSMATQSIYSNGKSIKYEFSNESRDSHGNWTRRRYTRYSTDAQGYTSTTSGTQKRSITYYN